MQLECYSPPYCDQALPGQLPEKQRQDGEKTGTVQRAGLQCKPALLPPYKPCELTETPASPRVSQTWLRVNKKHNFFSTCIGRISGLKPNSL